MLPDNLIIGTLIHREKEKYNRLHSITIAYVLSDSICKKINKKKSTIL